MNSRQEFAESRSSDPVIREMARLAGRILSDKSINQRERAWLIHRLEAEFHAYKAWNRQYASYFRTPGPGPGLDQPTDSLRQPEGTTK